MGRPVILYVILSGVRQHGVEESVFLFLRMEFAGGRILRRACGLLRMTEKT